MSRWKQKRKRWLDYHARLGNKPKNKSSRRLGPLSPELSKPGTSTTRITSQDKKPIVIQTPPKNFAYNMTIETKV